MNRNGYPAAVFCFLLGGASVWASQHAWRDKVHVGDKVEDGDCRESSDEPMRIICETAARTCVFYLETGQHQCVSK